LFCHSFKKIEFGKSVLVIIQYIIVHLISFIVLIFVFFAATSITVALYQGVHMLFVGIFILVKLYTYYIDFIDDIDGGKFYLVFNVIIGLFFYFRISK